MEKIIGFIGSGNMAEAMIGGITGSGLLKGESIIVSDLNEKRLDYMNSKYSVMTTRDSSEVASKSDILILSVKPNIYDIVMKGIKDNLKDDVIIVTIAAGKSIKSIEDVLGSERKIVRTMPNTPAMVSEGMTALCPNPNVKDEDLGEVKSIFDSFGKAEVVGEYLIDSVIGVSGSAPAYVFMFIEAMADAAVIGGMPRDKAYKFAAQAVLGSAKMVLETGKHPGELKDMVCSPGGTTIEAVATLEKEGFKGSVIKAICDCMDKSKKMSQN